MKPYVLSSADTHCIHTARYAHPTHILQCTERKKSMGKTQGHADKGPGDEERSAPGAAFASVTQDGCGRDHDPQHTETSRTWEDGW
jgi:hypothetical protein